jgi:hypothetical protein
MWILAVSGAGPAETESMQSDDNFRCWQHLADIGVPAYVRFAPNALPLETSPDPRKETAPAKGTSWGRNLQGDKVPHVGTIRM